MFKNAIIFRINAEWEQPPLAALEEALGMARFEPCGATQRESFGWVEPRGDKHGPLVESVGGQLILKLMGETKMLPASVVNERVTERCVNIEAETGRKPGSKLKKELKEEVELALLPQAFTKKGSTMMWLNPTDKFVVVDASSLKKADGLISQFVDALREAGIPITLCPIHTATSPSTAMAEWLITKEAPAGFSVDRDCELKSTDGDKAIVRYTRHTLDIDEIAEHIQVQGKLPTRLAMTYDGRVSFVLADDLSLKKIELQDVVLEAAGQDNSGFDADAAIITGELRKLIPSLIDALGGEAPQPGVPAGSEPGKPVAGESHAAVVRESDAALPVADAVN